MCVGGVGGGWAEGAVRVGRSVTDWNQWIAYEVVCRRGLGRGWTRRARSVSVSDSLVLVCPGLW